MTTVGEFLREKLTNMVTWLKGAGLPVDINVGDVSNVAIVAFAQQLRAQHEMTLKTEDFEPLLSDKENLPAPLLMTVSFVARNPELHHKFWRYMELFSDTVA